MYQAARTIDENKRSQEISERTTLIMDELSSTLVVGRSKAGPKNSGILSNERKGGVKVTFNGHQRPISVDVDPRFLFSTSNSSNNNNNNGDRIDGGIVSIDELNDAIADAMCDGYERSGKVMDDKLRGLYEQLGLSKDPISMPSFAQDEKK
jgi:DNA-binding protein YbaB